MDAPLRSPQRLLSAACESDLDRYGDTFRGVGYTKSAREAEERYLLMLEVVRERGTPVSLLDLGCGLAHLLDCLEAHSRFAHIDYTGLDISARYLEAARQRRPAARLILADVLDPATAWPDFDYVVLNGLFNYRGDLDQASMSTYWERLLAAVWPHARRGVAFNVMSTLVDWQRRDLFHLPFDTMAKVVATRLSPHFVVRHDYGAREYTVYVYRQPAG
jgi:SAM-dependent methyltransferase